MASTSLHVLALRRLHYAPPLSSMAHPSKPANPSSTTALPGRRQWLLLLTATTTTTLNAAELPSRAEDIPLFGLRKKLKQAEEEAEEVIKEGIETAEKEIQAAERGIETAEKGIETAVSFGGLAQAGAVAAAEAIGVVIATSVVNGILGPEGQKS